MQDRSRFLRLLAGLIAAASLTAQAASMGNSFADLMYQDMDWARGELMQRGYQPAGNADGIQYWQGGRDGGCARITLDRHNRVSDIAAASARDCHLDEASRHDAGDVVRSPHARHEGRHARQDGYSNEAPAVPVYDLQGARVSYGERELEHRGFESIDGHGAFSTWWNGRARECVQVSTRSGYYQSVNVVSPALCR